MTFDNPKRSYIVPIVIFQKILIKLGLQNQPNLQKIMQIAFFLAEKAEQCGF